MLIENTTYISSQGIILQGSSNTAGGGGGAVGSNAPPTLVVMVVLFGLIVGPTQQVSIKSRTRRISVVCWWWR